MTTPAFPTDDDPTEDDEEFAPPDPWWRKLIGSVIAFAVIAACVGGWVALDKKDEPWRPDSYGAKAACRTFVKEKLKAPTTADFSDEQVSQANGTWAVNGYVDSENSFGAKVRAAFQCEMTIDGNDWVGKAVVLG